MNLIAALALAVVAMLFVAYPLFRRQEDTATTDDGSSNSDPRLEELFSKRDSLYQAIRELDFDRSIGNLSDSDYQELRERLKRQAIGVLKEIDEIKATAGVALAEREAQVEEGVRKVRPPERSQVRAGSRKCPSCGEPFAPDDRFCRRCGMALALACPSCGQPYAEGDRFCARCGARLKGGRRG